MIISNNNYKKNVAWLPILKQVEYGFVVTKPQQVEATFITFVKRNRFAQWKIFSIGKVDDSFNEK